ncbi:MAG: hydroxyacid dehydrogenase [Rikenellaceae bacterium]|nr:hydroxyacid dehydrogenase [Rikenellaceae bacterium]MCL2693196.1 hydroxyacid dehydrogenase [Rikenellaceae bacterium]
MKIVFLDAYTVDRSDMAQIKALGDYASYDRTAENEIVERCAGADVVITNKVPLRATTLEQLAAMHVKLICIAATGMNNIDLPAAERLGIAVRNTAGYSTASVAELTFAGVLGLLKQIIYFDEFVKSGAYTHYGRLFDFTRPTYELAGKRWGVIGLGAIGRRVADIARAFGCEVSYFSTSGANSNPEYAQKPLAELLMESDIVSVHAPLSERTHNLIDYHELSLMKPTAVIANVARGGIVNEEGLMRALNDGLLAGAALDVYSHEPMTADNPLNRVRDKYRLLLTPHSAWSTVEAMQTLVDTIAENIRKFFGENK